MLALCLFAVTFQEISSYAEATLVLFSSSRATATTAKRICSSRNGSIATFNAKEIKQASLLLNDTYLKGLFNFYTLALSNFFFIFLLFFFFALVAYLSSYYEKAIKALHELA